MFQDEVAKRRLWPRTTTFTTSMAATATSQAVESICTAALPAGGLLKFNDTFTTIIDESITFEAPCNGTKIFGDRENYSGNFTVVKFDDPFYASVAPQIYALACATILSYLLVILIFITPRTFYVGSPGGGAGYLGARSMMPGSGSSSVLSVGRRPLLQKIATLTVAISLTIATADTFDVAEHQYNDGLMDSTSLVNEVIGQTEIRVIRIISDTFLWLAQVQTLIRLFPRHKEKVTIKWLGFALVTCDAVFSVLENFVSKTTRTSPRTFQDAIPALSYLFELSISLIYASCVGYYSLSKRRFAFWHPKMRNVILVAVLSLASVLIPVVFFILDISQPNIASWGEYIRWVGAAAASVVVWEWVERIEALERDEKKDGILGREIFDGDEMLDLTPSEGPDGHGKSTSYFGTRSRGNTSPHQGTGTILGTFPVRARIPLPKRTAKAHKSKPGKKNLGTGNDTTAPTANGHISRPPQAITPISRSDTNSAASTVYAVRYHNISSPSPAIPEEPLQQPDNDMQNGAVEQGDPKEITSGPTQNPVMTEDNSAQGKRVEETDDQLGSRQMWQAVSNPFKRRRAEPPAEVAAQIAESNSRRSPAQRYNNFRDRINTFTVAQKRRFTGRPATTASPPMPVTVIPAQPRMSRSGPGDGHDPPSTPQASGLGQLSEIPESRANRNGLPVTVIPAPVRGGRTWSPEEMDNTSSHASSSSSQRSGSGARNNQANAIISQSPTLEADGNVHSMRGSLTIAESPARVREGASGGSPVLIKRTSRTRVGATMHSISDRLESVSPASVAQRSSPAQITPSPGQHALPYAISENSQEAREDGPGPPEDNEKT